MKEINLPTGKYLLVSVPEDAKGLFVCPMTFKGKLEDAITWVTEDGVSGKIISPGSWQIISEDARNIDAERDYFYEDTSQGLKDALEVFTTGKIILLKDKV